MLSRPLGSKDYDMGNPARQYDQSSSRERTEYNQGLGSGSRQQQAGVLAQQGAF